MRLDSDTVEPESAQNPDHREGGVELRAFGGDQDVGHGGERDGAAGNVAVDGADHRRVHALKAPDRRVQDRRPGLDDPRKLRKVLDEGADISADREEAAFGRQQDGAHVVPAG